MRDLGDATHSIFDLYFEVVWKQFGQVFAVIVIVLVDIAEKVNQPFPEVYIVSLATAQHGIHDCCIFSGIMISTEQPVLPT